MKKINLTFFITTLVYSALVFLALPNPEVFAQTNQELINQQNWITRQQQNILEENKRDREFEAIKKDRERKKKEVEEGEGQRQKVSQEIPNKCFSIKEVSLIGADSLSKRQQNKIIKPFLGKCFESKILAEVIAAVNSYYQAHGYITVQVLVPQQNLQSGIFELKIIEGKIEKISLGKDRMIEDMQEFTAFGSAEGEVLNIKDINQGIYQINRLQSNHAVMQIKPGSTDGQSNVVIANEKKLPARLTVSRDNLGNKFTGIQRTGISSGIDNLLFLNDQINLNYTTNIHDDSQVKDIRSFSSGISIPFKYNTFSYDYSRSEFRGQNPGQNGPTKFSGYSDQNKFGLERVLKNSAAFRLTTNASLTAKKAASYLNDAKLVNSERKLAIVNFDFAISSYLNDTTSIYIKPSYSRGTKLLNAEQDQKNISQTTAKAQFDVFKLYATASKRLIIPLLNAPVNLTTEMDSQYAKQTLFGSEQFSVGGYYSVRGFRESYITGDSGYYLRNKANFNLGSLILPHIKKENPGFLSHLNKIKLEPFYDYGHTKYKHTDDGSDGRLSGTGIKTIFESRYFNASLTYSKAINKSRLITSTQKENHMVYFELSASCC